MVVDTSAVLAILLNESDAEKFELALETDPVRLMSAAIGVRSCHRYGSVLWFGANAAVFPSAMARCNFSRTFSRPVKNRLR
jgi:hypothetical protein